jgi:hypothetical protein
VAAIVTIAWDATEMTAHYDAAAIATTQHGAATFDKRNRALLQQELQRAAFLHSPAGNSREAVKCDLRQEREGPRSRFCLEGRNR